jgi:hypothetical protein
MRVAQLDEDLILAEAQRHAGLRSRQVHDDARLVLEPEIARLRGLEADRAGFLDPCAGELGDVVELVDVAADGDFRDAARSEHGSKHLEGIGLAVKRQRARSDPHAARENLGHRDLARGCKARDALGGRDLGRNWIRHRIAARKGECGEHGPHGHGAKTRFCRHEAPAAICSDANRRQVATAPLYEKVYAVTGSTGCGCAAPDRFASPSVCR